MAADATFTPGQLRALMIAVVVMGFILMFGLAGLVVAIAYRSSATKAKGPDGVALPAAGRPAPTLAQIKALYAGGASAVRLLEARLPPGARVISAQAAGDRLTVVAEDAGGASVLILDLAGGGRLDTVVRLSSD